MKPILPFSLVLLLANATPAADWSAIETSADETRCVAFHPTQAALVTAASRQVLWIDLEQRVVSRTFDGAPGAIYEVAFSDDGNTLVSAGRGVTVWNVADGATRLVLDTQYYQHHLAVSAARNLIATAGEAVYLWDLDSGALRARVELGGEIESMALAPDASEILVSLKWGDRILAIDPSTGETIRQLRGVSRARGLAYNPDGSGFAMTNMPWKLKFVSRGGEPAVVVNVRGATYALDYDPTGSLLAVGTWLSTREEMLHLVDTESGEVTRSYGPIESPIFEVVFSPDGSMVAAGTKGSAVYLATR